MKKIIASLFIIFSLVFISGCSQESLSDELQANTWQVASTNGEAYLADFGEDTVIFYLSVFSKGFSYEISQEDDKQLITMTELDNENVVLEYEVTQNEDEFQFIAETEELEEEFGDLTLMPSQQSE